MFLHGQEAEAHTFHYPGYTMVLACSSSSPCKECAKFSPAALAVSDLIRKLFCNEGPILRKRADNHWMSLFEHMANPLTEPPPQPEDYSYCSYRKCLLCRRCYYTHRSQIERHRTLAHPNQKLEEVCAFPFQCPRFHQRPVDADGMPWGEFEYCEALFKTKDALDEHIQNEHPWPIIHQELEQTAAAPDSLEPDLEPVVSYSFIS